MSSDRDKVLFQELVAKAWEDDAFLKSLVANPKQALKDAGISVSDSATVEVLQDTASEAHVALPVNCDDKYLSEVMGRLKKALPLKRKVQLVQNTDQKMYCVIPVKPEGYSAGSLSEDQLASVSGGGNVVTNVTVEGVVVVGAVTTVVVT